MMTSVVRELKRSASTGAAAFAAVEPDRRTTQSYIKFARAAPLGNPTPEQHRRPLYAAFKSSFSTPRPSSPAILAD